MCACVMCGKLATYFHSDRCADKCHSKQAYFCYNCMPACYRCGEHVHCKNHRQRCVYCDDDKCNASYCSVCIQYCEECEENVCILHDGAHKEKCVNENPICIAPICPVLKYIVRADRENKQYLQCEGGKGFGCEFTESFGFELLIDDTLLLGDCVRHCHCRRFTHIWFHLNMNLLKKACMDTSLLSNKFKLIEKHSCNAVSMPMIPLKGFGEKYNSVVDCEDLSEWDTERKTRHCVEHGCHMCHSRKLYYPLFQLLKVNENVVSDDLMYIKWFYMCENGHVLLAVGIP